MKNLGAIQETLLTEGWFEIKRLIEARMMKALVTLADTKRPAVPSDDALRGLISECQWVLDFEKRVTRATAEALVDKEAEAAEDEGGIGSPMTPDPEVPTT